MASHSTELIYDRGHHHDFVTAVNELAPAGELTGDNKYEFNFPNTEKQFDSYSGLNVRLRCVPPRMLPVLEPHCLRYYLKVSILRGFPSNIEHEHEIWVMNFGLPLFAFPAILTSQASPRR